jgi:hypothetical protein
MKHRLPLTDVFKSMFCTFVGIIIKYVGLITHHFKSVNYTVKISPTF